ncbi:Unknown protein [Striga hermonthica]|uniref:Uncharacterized protein n=1 Tax=Striga hermonthica TaxID=68872 RepID=A0A9N7NIB1_STRHE|nr:Unknown protein [Striga hermonthica]
MEGAKVTVRKTKKKQVKDELDRIKQAEKKKRRLEKALATSAAIRSELEKKKQKKKDEQERLDEEGARISEAVALHVLLGEDSDDLHKNIIMEKDEGPTLWDHEIIVGQGQPLIPFCDLSRYSPLGNIGWLSEAHAYVPLGNYWENSNIMVSSDPTYVENFCSSRYFGDEVWGSVGHLAAHAESSLKIADDDDAYVLNYVLRG